MRWLGDSLDRGARKLRTLPVPARRWLAVLSVPALAVGLLVGTLLGPGSLGARGLSTVIQLPLASGDAASPAGQTDVVAGTDSGPTLGAPSGNVAAPASPSTPAPTPAPLSTPTATPTTTPTTTPSDPTPAPTPDTPAQTPATPTDNGGADTTDGPTLTGTVIRVNPVAHSYALADGDTPLVAVHTPDLPDVGRKVSVEGRELSNGTYAEKGSRKLTGRASTAKLSGTVTYSDPSSAAYTVSSRGTSVLVHLGDQAAAADSSPSPDPAAPSGSADKSILGVLVRAIAAGPPPVGSDVTVTVKLEAVPPPVEDGTSPAAAPAAPAAPAASQIGGDATPAPTPAPLCQKPADATAPAPPAAPAFRLVEQDRQVAADLLGYSDFEGVVQAVCTTPARLVISADDVRESGVDLRIAIPKDIELSGIEAGQAVDATAEIADKTGALELTGLSSEDGVSGADDPAAAFGDQAGG